MSLQVWLPLTKDTRNQGLSNVTVTNNGVTFTNGGKLGEKYFSAGTITIPASSSNSIFNGTHMSFSFWLKPVGTSGTSVIFGQSNMSVGNNRMYSIFQYPTPNDLHISWQSETSNSTFIGFSISGFFEADKWTHCALVYDGSKLLVYKNGVLNGTYNGVNTRTAFNYDYPINGSSIRCLNDFRIYDHCLSPMEVKELSKGLILHYPLNRGGFGPSNLLKNGFGELDRENWGNSNVYTDVPSGHSEIKKSYRDNESVEFIPLFRNCTYKFTGWIKAASTSGSSYPSLKPYDADKLFISTYNCREGFNLNTMTTLKQQLKAGDTKIYVNDLSAWNANSGHYYDVAAIFSYTDGQGYTWPDGIYTRNCPAFASSTEAKTNLDKTNNIITLLTAYTGPTMPAGTKVCASTYGSTYFYPWGGISNSSITDWTYKEGTFSSENVRMECAKYIRVYAYSTCYQAGMTLSNLTVDNLMTNIEYDTSGYCNNGTKTGTFSWTSDTPKYSVSTQFDSTSTKIQLPVIDFSGMANSYTFAWWQYNISTGNMPWGFSNGNRLNCYHCSPLCWNTGDGSSNQFKNNGATIAPTEVQNGWHHMVVTGDGTATKLYIDGEYKGTAITYKPLTGTQIWISGWDSGTSYTFSGCKECDFRIYATALSADDVKSLYQNCATIDANGTIHGQIRS